MSNYLGFAPDLGVAWVTSSGLTSVAHTVYHLDSRLASLHYCYRFCVIPRGTGISKILVSLAAATGLHFRP